MSAWCQKPTCPTQADSCTAQIVHLANTGETDQRCLIVRVGAVAGAVACLDPWPARPVALAGVRGRRDVQNHSTASATAALTSA